MRLELDSKRALPCLKTEEEFAPISILLSWNVYSTLTDNQAQGQSAKFVDANGVIFCLNCHERLRDFHYLPKDEKITGRNSYVM